MAEKILVVDDEPSILQSLKGVLEDEGYETVLVGSAEAALEEIQRDAPHLILLDIWLPGMDGMEMLDRVKKTHPTIPVIIISGHGTIETAVRATRVGAFDFIEKPLSVERILVSVQNALQVSRLEADNLLWRQKAERRQRLTGESAAIVELRDQIRRAAPSHATVLVTGENGTGKELVARSIHFLSPRKNRPLIEVNCAAIPEELIESELFGHEKGAFTGAQERRRGKFDLADGGTLFLDEIGDMSLKTQAKILRIIQEQSFERVGGSKTIRVDVRIVAATNKDLQAEIEAGRFRQDLFFRLNVIPLHVPPLRERLDDIPLLVEDFLNELSQESTLGRKEIDPEVLERLKRYDWPGNVRELKNFVERLVIMTPGRVIRPHDLPRDFVAQQGRAPGGEDPFRYPTLKEARFHFERQYLLKKLEENDWNVSLTAQNVGLERSHLHRKMKVLGIRGDNGGDASPGRS
ncbi:two component, sigma54 specific, transcriptional regulator, Fis family [Desulfacinum hydrothermale DSM 13146]|uniref:Two component, sigma54 specific, transcriptional regulator, Fis family n=1 Tax=Desulfacinum hydrothermale DSM 13146 TaxID=1121390 RepID=A0A1W1XFK9_9BACT|nr:sigma-54 dependent transcriptional regulator [Desulfacinum hydrothermale]SMC22746.1 two component, sigma54 specific, transcriptional regulator, Fis family [Desulfacinum hydrothermale DSM 13146]